MKLLIDECLTPELARLAREQGYGESSHVVWLGRSGAKDWELVRFVLAGDWTFVTRNAEDFRGPSEAPGSRGRYADVAIHAGLICLGAQTMDLALQVELFDFALDALRSDPDLVNQVLEVFLTDEGDIRLLRYAMPED